MPRSMQRNAKSPRLPWAIMIWLLEFSLARDCLLRLSKLQVGYGSQLLAVDLASRKKPGPLASLQPRELGVSWQVVCGFMSWRFYKVAPLPKGQCIYSWFILLTSSNLDSHDARTHRLVKPPFSFVPTNKTAKNTWISDQQVRTNPASFSRFSTDPKRQGRISWCL